MEQVKLALTGKMRSGKDTIAEYLIRKYNFKRFAFGDGIRNVCKEMFPEIVAQGKPRWLYQGVGQDFRKYDPDVWVKWLFWEMEQNPYPWIVVTDLRQPNEYDALVEAGFIIIKVHCSTSIRIERMKASGDNFNPEDLNHETEQHIDSFRPHFEIDNSGTIADLITEVEIVREILIGEGVEGYYGKR